MNPERGEYRIEVGDHVIEGKLNATLLKRLEIALDGRSVMDMAQKMTNPTTEQLVILVQVVSKDKWTLEQIYEDLALWEMWAIVNQFLAVFNNAFVAPPEGEKSKGKPQTSRSRGASGSA